MLTEHQNDLLTAARHADLEDQRREAETRRNERRLWTYRYRLALYLSDRMPQSRPLPIPSVPSLAVMTITLQRNHMYALTFRERATLACASWVLMCGEDADDQTQIEYLERVHRIWTRVTVPAPGGAA